MTVVSTDNQPPIMTGGMLDNNSPVEDVDQSGYVDYFGFDDNKIFTLPDGKQWIEFKPLNEGQRAKYEQSTSRDVTFNRRSDNAAIKIDQGSDRHALIMASVTGWNVVRRQNGTWVQVPFDARLENGHPKPGGQFDQWMNSADPKIVSDLHAAIRKANPWMTEDMTVEMIDEEILRLQELRVEVAEREAAGKSS